MNGYDDDEINLILKLIFNGFNCYLQRAEFFMLTLIFNINHLHNTNILTNYGLAIPGDLMETSADKL